MSTDKNNAMTVETLQKLADETLNNIFGEFAPFIRSGDLSDLPGAKKAPEKKPIVERVELPRIGFDDFRTKVKFYPYRTARVFGTRITLNRYNEDVHKFEHDLAKAAGVNTDNHSCYAIQVGDEAPLYVWCTDGHLHIGTKLLEESW